MFSHLLSQTRQECVRCLQEGKYMKKLNYASESNLRSVPDEMPPNQIHVMAARNTPYIFNFRWCRHYSRLFCRPLTLLTAGGVLGMLLRSALTWVVSGTGRHDDLLLATPCNGRPFVLSEGGQEASVEHDLLTFDDALE